MNEDASVEDVLVMVREHPDATVGSASAQIYFRWIRSAYLPVLAAL